MLKIGSYNDLVVERVVGYGLYLNPKEDEVLLPKKFVPENAAPGDTIRVFVYTDSEDRPVATTLDPLAVVGDFAYLKVKDEAPFGVFMDWGLEKDLFIPKSEQQERMPAGKSYVVKVCLDEKTNRVYGSSRISQHCNNLPKGITIGQKVSLLIYSITKIGIMAIVDNQYMGMLYKNEAFEPVAIGDRKQGYIKWIRNDGKIDLSLKQPGYESITPSGNQVMKILKKWDGFVPCHDKSAPEDIRKIFAMSKKEFKRAIGRLYKERKINITDRGIQLSK